MHANGRKYRLLHFAIRNFREIRILAEMTWRLLIHMSVLVRRIQAPRYRRQDSNMEELSVSVRCRLLSAHSLLHKTES